MSEAGRKTKKTREDRIIELVRLGAWIIWVSRIFYTKNE